MPVRAILLDWEGTIVREDSVFLASPAATVARYARRRLHLDISADQFDQVIESALPPPGSPPPRLEPVLAAAFALAGRPLSADELTVCCRVFFETATHRYTVFDDALTLLHGLRGGELHAGVITNSLFPSAFFPHLLADLDLAGCLDFLLTSADLGVALPAAEPFEIALRTLDIPAHEAMYVSTRLATGLRPARELGLHVALLDRTGERRQAPATRVIERLTPLQDLLPEPGLPR